MASREKSPNRLFVAQSSRLPVQWGRSHLVAVIMFILLYSDDNYMLIHSCSDVDFSFTLTYRLFFFYVTEKLF